MQALAQDLATEAPPTEGVKYAGSKRALVPHILALAKRVPAKRVLDGFAGTTRVSQALALAGYQVHCNDLSVWSEAFGRCYLLGHRQPTDYTELIRHLNALPPQDGWFTEHYGGQPNGGCAVQHDGLKRPWQIHNTRKLDAIRQEIDLLRLSPVDRAVALASLMLALDQVDSTLGHFASYLREWSPRSYHELVLRVPQFCRTAEPHSVSCADALDLLPRVSVDLAYFDPPYGSNNEKMPPSRVRYASYYHLWTTVCLNDRPALFGKAQRRCDTSDRVSGSVFEEYRRSADHRFVAVEALERLIAGVQARWIILSYSSGGRATAAELHDVVRRHGRLIDVVAIEHKRNAMSGMRWTHEWLRAAEEPNREYLFLVEKA